MGGQISESCAGVLVKSAVLEFVELTTVAVEGLKHEQVSHIIHLYKVSY